MMATCPVCGKTFQPVRSSHRYCSAACRRYANRHGLVPARMTDPNKPVIREFRCLRCHEPVVVTEQGDCRTKFCSHRCEKLYWKHPKRARTKTVYREFSCRECGEVVRVTEPLDRRTIFCSSECRKKWFNARRHILYD